MQGLPVWLTQANVQFVYFLDLKDELNHTDKKPWRACLKQFLVNQIFLIIY